MKKTSACNLEANSTSRRIQQNDAAILLHILGQDGTK